MVNTFNQLWNEHLGEYSKPLPTRQYETEDIAELMDRWSGGYYQDYIETLVQEVASDFNKYLDIHMNFHKENDVLKEYPVTKQWILDELKKAIEKELG